MQQCTHFFNWNKYFFFFYSKKLFSRCSRWPLILLSAWSVHTHRCLLLNSNWFLHISSLFRTLRAAGKIFIRVIVTISRWLSAFDVSKCNAQLYQSRFHPCVSTAIPLIFSCSNEFTRVTTLVSLYFTDFFSHFSARAAGVFPLFLWLLFYSSVIYYRAIPTNDIAVYILSP